VSEKYQTCKNCGGRLAYVRYGCATGEKFVWKHIGNRFTKPTCKKPELNSQEKTRPAAACVWSQDSAGSSWATGCGQLFELNEGTPKENRMGFCCYCGRTLNEHPYVEDDAPTGDDQPLRNA
jgi:hypothetical protein